MPSTSDLLTVVGVIGTAFGAALGAFSIVVTWKLYQESCKINVRILELLGEVRVSSHTAEVTSTRFTEKLVTGLIQLQGRDLRDRLSVAHTTLSQRVDSIFRGVLKSGDSALAEKARSKVQEELADSFRAINYETASVSQLTQRDTPSSVGLSENESVMIAPGTARLIEWLERNKDKYDFFSVRWLRDKVFGGDPALQEALQFAIDYQMLILGERENPKKPEYPTTTCELNRDHPMVRRIIEQAQ